MKLIVGLGNPGRPYRATRHNVGADVIDVLARRHRLGTREEGWAAVAVLAVSGQRGLLAKPQTYVNVSGTAVADLRRRHRVAVSDVLVVVDDLDLPAGQLRLRPKGGHGGHNGLRSIIDALGSTEFPRLRIGIGRPPEGVEPADFVLTRAAGDERASIDDAVERAADAVEVFIGQGIEPAMNAFNPPRASPSRG